MFPKTPHWPLVVSRGSFGLSHDGPHQRLLGRRLNWLWHWLPRLWVVHLGVTGWAGLKPAKVTQICFLLIMVFTRCLQGEMSKSCLKVKCSCIDFWRWIYCLCDVLEMLELFWWKFSHSRSVTTSGSPKSMVERYDKIKSTKTVGCLKIMQPPCWLQMLSFSINNMNMFFHRSETCEFRMILTSRATPGEYRSKYQRDYHGFHRTNES